MNKGKVSIGESLIKDGSNLVVEELFSADSVRWVMASKVRRKLSCGYYSKRYISYLIENMYFTEFEWIRMRGISL